MKEWLIGCSVRLIRHTKVVDRILYGPYSAFKRARWELVLALGSDALLDRYNDLSYSSDDAYRAGSRAFRNSLFAWEEEAIGRFFPPAPARILIGAAGGGREAFALAQRGYRIVAFERSRVPVESMAAQITDGIPVEVYKAGYEQLPLLLPAVPGQPTGNLEDMPPFDAAIIGWTSFTHLRTDDLRVRTLQAFGRVTNGPVLVSFLARPEEAGRTQKLSRLQRLLPAGYNRDPGNFFDVNYGLFHRYSQSEINSTVDRAGLTISHLSLRADEMTWPYAILERKSDAASGLP